MQNLLHKAFLAGLPFKPSPNNYYEEHDDDDENWMWQGNASRIVTSISEKRSY